MVAAAGAAGVSVGRTAASCLGGGCAARAGSFATGGDVGAESALAAGAVALLAAGPTARAATIAASLILGDRRSAVAGRASFFAPLRDAPG